ncbi:hypothetical protein CYMTET_22003 [Cymbomonas tetramitiformis]|uniref:EGF-like domain-containing protein n=1 Tax=Cymbomonas tetramitiformis TaxID=36881 RepID=A0AAE0G141_9CHLO|nr:hypothetical protein CYMTET_22003 [Cymbomonas tetramitiformis]
MPWIIISWAICLLTISASMLWRLSVEAPWIKAEQWGKAGLVNTGHLWCCHGPFTCQRPPFLSFQTGGGKGEAAAGSAEEAEGMQPGECACEEGFAGEGCEPVCSGCSNHGSCFHPSVCQCEPGWTGDECATPECFSPCFHGSCTAPGVCTCDEGYYGNMCETYCSKHGHFRGDPIDLQRKGFNAKEVERLLRIVDCFCDDGWEGRDCSKPVCATNKCVHGECIAPDKCKCMHGWVGADCAVVPSKGKFLFSSLDLDVQRQKAFQNKLGQLADTKAKLHDLQRQEKRATRLAAPPPWKPSWLNGANKPVLQIQSRTGRPEKAAFKKSMFED